jgi:enoyl-CoA hydratase/carnithine racemase
MADKVTVEREGQVLLIGVNRPEKRNAWDLDIIPQSAWLPTY